MPAKLKDPDSHFIQIDINFAKEFGVNEAIMAGKALRLIDKLVGAKDDDGNKWVRLTLEEWRKELPFLSEMTIRRTLESLEDKKIFLSTTFSGRSKWYRINPNFVESGHNTSVQNEQKHYGNCSKRTDTSVQNEQLPRVHPIESTLLLTRDDILDKIGNLCRMHFFNPDTEPGHTALLDACQKYKPARVLWAIELALSPEKANGKSKNWGYVLGILEKDKNGTYQNGATNGHKNGASQENTQNQSRQAQSGQPSRPGQNGSQQSSDSRGISAQIAATVARIQRERGAGT